MEQNNNYQISFFLKIITSVITVGSFFVTHLISYISKNNKYKRKLSERVSELELNLAENYPKKKDISELIERINRIEKKLLES